MKAVAKTIKGDISRYNEVKAFAQFGTSDLDQSTRNLLNRGEKLMEILKQGQYKPMAVEEEIVALAAIDYVLDLPTADVRRFEEELIQYIKDHHSDLLKAIRETGDLSGDNSAALKEALASFKGTFRASES